MTTSHQDESRKEVGLTAHAVAYMRGLESAKGPGIALIYDPYAEALSTTIGKKAAEEFGRLANVSVDDDHFHERVSGLGVRSRKIDDTIMKAIQSGYRQVVVLGAGLDTRPWRLHLQPHYKEDTSILSEVSWFEVDFPELFQFKLPVLANEGARTMVKYHNVEADLSLPTWFSKLLDGGYDPNVATFWLLEGLTGYLTEEECRALFTNIYTNTGSGSRLLATFIGENRESLTTMHRFKTSHPLDFVYTIGGWTAGTELALNEISLNFGRKQSSFWDSYFFVEVEKS